VSESSSMQVSKAPTIVPWGHRFRFAAELNAMLTAWVVRRRVRRDTDPAVLWLYDPCFAGCIGRSGERFAVYDCVDDYAEQTGGDARKRALLSVYDGLAASRSRLVFATARGLAERHRETNEKTFLVGNVADFDHFAPAADRSIAAADVALLNGPVIGFAGNFLAGKVDFALLEAVATSRPEWTVLLVGPAREDTRAALGGIARKENVRWLGRIAYEDLPRYVAAFDVATIPYLRNPYTRSCFPLKTFEYLAAGKPVVASGLPELAGMDPHVVVADDADAFVAAVEDALLHRSDAEAAARQEIAAGNTWETRTRRLLELVGAEL
jgi:glycosyltransferase involved in cell wall biosynthesis